MNIKKLDIVSQGDGTVNCRSRFYSAFSGFPYLKTFHFTVGKNVLYEEIDSGAWALCYAMSMYGIDKEIQITNEPDIRLNGNLCTLSELAPHCCYMDPLYPLFSKKISVKQAVEHGIKRNSLPYYAENLRVLFKIDKDRYERPLSGMGNEIFKAMGAIGVAEDKDIFCFPWQSRERCAGYHLHFSQTADALAELGKIAVIPLGLDAPEAESEVLSESKMYVSDVRNYSEIGDCDVIVLDGKYTVCCYCYDRKISVGEKINVLCGDVSSDIIKSEKREFSAEKISEPYAYSFSAQVADRDRSIVRVGNLFIRLLASLSLDFDNGDFIIFSSSQLSIFEDKRYF